MWEVSWEGKNEMINVHSSGSVVLRSVRREHCSHLETPEDKQAMAAATWSLVFLLPQDMCPLVPIKASKVNQGLV